QCPQVLEFSQMLQCRVFDPDGYTKLARIAQVDGDDGIRWLLFVSRDPAVDPFDPLHSGGFVGACRPGKNEDRECRYPALVENRWRPRGLRTLGHNDTVHLRGGW